jgi:hypothetical protein
MSASSRQEAEVRYAQHRAVALQQAEAFLRPVVPAAPISLRAITPEAMQTFEMAWQECPDRRYPWPWPQMVEHYHRNEPTRFEAAVWSGETLCGLALGRLRSGYCSADYLEGSPLPAHPLKGFVLPAMLTALAAYAVARQRAHIRLVDPVAELVPRYEALGFALAQPRGEPRYCWKVVP